MDLETCKALEEALNITPDNHILRKQLSKAYFALKEYTQAKDHLNILIEQTRDADAKVLLAECYMQLGNYSAGLIICEELLELTDKDEVKSLYLNLLIKDGNQPEAIEQYQKFQQENPNWRDEQIEDQLKIKQETFADSDYEEESEDLFMEKPDISFAEVGGMDNIKEEIRIKIIHPLTNPDLFKAFGKKAGGGILLYGPPGCGKTYLARATAGEINSKFISVGLDEVLDMWLGNSEKNLHQKFEVARKNNPCVLFFDEIDALGSKRNDLKQSSSRHTINQFLKELDGIDSDNEGVLILGATNSPWHMDTAFLRPGRFDRIIFVPPPDEAAREIILQLHLKDKPIDNIDYKKIALKTNELSGADLQQLIDIAVEENLRLSMKTGKIEAITTKNLLKALKNVRASTKDWFNTARNYALYSNTSGMYDDILKYLKIKP